MSTSQSHGNSFEDMVRNCGLFPGSNERKTAHTALFDIDSQFDPRLALPTSIKTSKIGTSIGLADARRLWAIDHPFRMIVAPWRQAGPRQKVIAEIHEFIILPATLLALKGQLSADEVKAIHEGIGYGFFGKASFDDARAWAKREIESIKHKYGAIVLNQKIQAFQRRLQCSVSLEALISIVPDDNHILYRQRMSELALPIILTGSPRIFRERP